MTATETDETTGKTVVVATKISPTDRKNLEKVVTQDYDALYQDLKLAASKALTKREEDIRKEFAAKQARGDVLASQATELRKAHLRENESNDVKLDAALRKIRAEFDAEKGKRKEKFNAALGKIVERAEKAGIALSRPSSSVEYHATVTDLDAALAAAHMENSRELAQATSAWREAKTAALRGVLLLGVADEGKDFIAAQPTASDAFLATARARNGVPESPALEMKG